MLRTVNEVSYIILETADSFLPRAGGLKFEENMTRNEITEKKIEKKEEKKRKILRSWRKKSEKNGNENENEK